jgi:hypothetical protein
VLSRFWRRSWRRFLYLPAIAEAETGLAILNGLPHDRMNSEAFLQAAGYYRAKGNRIAMGGATLLQLDAAKLVELEDAISAAYLRIGDPGQSVAAAAAAVARPKIENRNSWKYGSVYWPMKGELLVSMRRIIPCALLMGGMTGAAYARIDLTKDVTASVPFTGN